MKDTRMMQRVSDEWNLHVQPVCTISRLETDASKTLDVRLYTTL